MSRKHALLIGYDAVGLASLAAQLDTRYATAHMTGLDDIGPHLARFRPDILLVQYVWRDEKSGRALVTRIRRVRPLTPIVAFCEDNEYARIDALEAGADDALGFCGISELSARMDALVRRSLMHMTPRNCTLVGRVMLDHDRHMVYLDGAVVDVTGVEYRVLCRLAKSKDAPVDRGRLIKCCSERASDPRTVDVTIGRLRKKFADSKHRIIQTAEKGEGYILAA